MRNLGLRTDGWKNKNNTGERSCKCGTWKKHWLNFSKKEWPEKCSVEGCNSKPTLGAHIFNHYDNTKKEYIAPFCAECNAKQEMFNLKGGVTLVPANKSETCEK